jgi:hypothetical protein
VRKRLDHSACTSNDLGLLARPSAQSLGLMTLR